MSINKLYWKDISEDIKQGNVGLIDASGLRWGQISLHKLWDLTVIFDSDAELASTEQLIFV